MYIIEKTIQICISPDTTKEYNHDNIYVCRLFDEVSKNFKFPANLPTTCSTLCFSDFFRKNMMKQALVFQEGNSTGIFSVYGVTEGSGAISCSV